MKKLFYLLGTTLLAFMIGACTTYDDVTYEQAQAYEEALLGQEYSDEQAIARLSAQLASLLTAYTENTLQLQAAPEDRSTPEQTALSEANDAITTELMVLLNVLHKNEIFDDVLETTNKLTDYVYTDVLTEMYETFKDHGFHKEPLSS